MSQTILSVRPDKAAKQQRIIERMEELSTRTGAPVNRLVLEALRQFLDYQEGNKPSVETVLQNATSLMGTVSTALAIQRQQITVLENLANAFNGSLVVEHARVDAILGAVMGLIKESHSEWPQEQLDGLKALLSPTHPKLPPSLFKGRGPLGDEAGRGEGNDSGLSR
jgi:hypothetical protein